MNNVCDYLFSNLDGLRQWIENPSLRVCVFGAGRYGSGSGYLILSQMLGFKVSCFCDNNPNKWGRPVVGTIPCISPRQLIEEQSDYLCFLAVGMDLQNEVLNQLSTAGVKRLVPFAYPCSEIVIAEVLRKRFYSFAYRVDPKYPLNGTSLEFNWERKKKNGKVVVYTCVTNNYDEIPDPQWQSDDVDWVVISDKPLDAHSLFQWYDLRNVVPESIVDPVLQNRYCKINAHKIFSEYKASIYVDGNIQVAGDVTRFLEYAGESGIATHIHPVRNCLYDEGLLCAVYKKADVGAIRRQLEAYYVQGMPAGFGLFELNVLARFHNKAECVRIMDTWWREVASCTHRDQLSFTYALWKNGFSLDSVGILGGDVKNNPLLRVKGHRTGAGQARTDGWIQSEELHIQIDGNHGFSDQNGTSQIAIVVRTTGERTTRACCELLHTAFPFSPLLQVNEIPFENAIKKTFQEGIASGKRWILVVDADVLVHEKGLRELTSMLEHVPESVFVVQGIVFDKFFNVFRPAGNHVYRSAVLEKALEIIPEPGDSLRPETTLIDRMICSGHEMLQCSAVVGLHDFGQCFVDIAKKAFLQSHKHTALKDSLLRLWKERSSQDLDFHAALLGWELGRRYAHQVYVDSLFMEKQVAMAVQMDDKLSSGQDCERLWSSVQVDERLKEACSRLDNVLQAEVFPRALWNRIYNKKL